MVVRSWFIVCTIALILAGCGSGEVTKVMSVEERFAHAKSLFDKGNHLDAINEFTVITLQYQGSAFAADAQYYLGECRFERDEYLLAAFEFSVVKRNYPASPRVADAQYKMGVCYYTLAPRSSLDQQYTRRALDELQSFVEYYPSHEKAVDAEAKIKDLTVRLAKKQYDTAKLYRTMEYYRAALFYFDDVIEKYHDTEYAPLSSIDKTELLIGRNRYTEAAAEAKRFMERYPNSVLRGRMETLRKNIDEELSSRSPATVTPGKGGTL
jgi:outer membrane protein assembly factor BamD